MKGLLFLMIEKKTGLFPEESAIAIPWISADGSENPVACV